MFLKGGGRPGPGPAPIREDSWTQLLPQTSQLLLKGWIELPQAEEGKAIKEEIGVDVGGRETP